MPEAEGCGLPEPVHALRPVPGRGRHEIPDGLRERKPGLPDRRGTVPGETGRGRGKAGSVLQSEPDDKIQQLFGKIILYTELVFWNDHDIITFEKLLKTIKAVVKRDGAM